MHIGTPMNFRQSKQFYVSQRSCILHLGINHSNRKETCNKFQRKLLPPTTSSM